MKEKVEPKRRCLVTGGAGFVGSHLCDRLLGQGFGVTALDNLSLGRISNLAGAMKTPDFAFLEGDILDAKLLDSAFKTGDFDVVFHMAANSDIERGGKETDRDLNLTFLTTFRALDAMGRFGVRDLVFASSSAMYGETRQKMAEDSGPLRPVSFYGAAKLAAEAYISAFVNCFGLRAWIYRFPNVVGSRMTHGVVYDFIGKLKKDPTQLLILGDGTQSKPFLHVDDLIDAILLCLEDLKEPVNYVNVGVDSATSVRRVAEIVVGEMGLADVEFRYTGGDRGWTGDVPSYAYDLTRIKSLGWEPRYTSDEAVRQAAREMLAG